MAARGLRADEVFLARDLKRLPDDYIRLACPAKLARWGAELEKLQRAMAFAAGNDAARRSLTVELERVSAERAQLFGALEEKRAEATRLQQMGKPHDEASYRASLGHDTIAAAVARPSPIAGGEEEDSSTSEDGSGNAYPEE